MMDNIIKYLQYFLCIVCFTVFANNGNVIANDKEKKTSALDQLKQDYEFTDIQKSCINTRIVRQSRIIDNQHILFELNGGKFYLNELPHRCSGLKFEGRYTYNLRGTVNLCHVDIITVIDSFMTPVMSCGLGKFKKLEKIKKKAVTNLPIVE